MGKKELIVKSLVCWFVATGLFFGIACYILSLPGAQPVLELRALFAIIGILVATMICWSGKLRDWLRE